MRLIPIDMNKKLIIAVLCLNILSSIKAQTIHMYFPHFAGKAYDFIIFQGDRQKTICQGSIPSDGKFTLTVPKEYSPYTGMSRWLITNSPDGGGLDMLIPGENFSVSCKAAKPDDSNIIYAENSQLEELNQLYKKQEVILMKYEATRQVIRSFDKDEKNYSIFEQEYEDQKTSFKNFYSTLKKDSDYAKDFLQIANITRGIGTELRDTEKENAENIADYIANEMKWQVLYTSGYWSSVISSWINIHTQRLTDPYAFANDFARISNRMKDKKLYADFAGKVSYFLTQQGKDVLIGTLAPYVIASGMVTQYEGPLASYTKGIPGTLAPDLIFAKYIGNLGTHNDATTVLKSSELAGTEYNKTLLIFYESKCGPCGNLLQQLPGNYQDLRSKGIRIISISADENEKEFREIAKDFLWKDAYCDLEGFKGQNFRNFGISGTPTLLLLDNTGRILLKTASLEELLSYVKLSGT